MVKYETFKNKLDSEEGQRKAETLFSKKFIEYLSNKKSLTSSPVDPTYARPRDKSPSTSGKEDYLLTSSSDETLASDTSKKSSRKEKRRYKETSPTNALTFNYALRSKLVQCSLIKDTDELALPDDLKPLLMNMTILLQDLKKSPSETAEFDNLYNLISKITILVTELSRRPIRKGKLEEKEHSKHLGETTKTMIALLKEYKNGPESDSENRFREYKQMEKDIKNKDHQIAEIKKKISEESVSIDKKASEMNVRVKNSILINERLKAQIKFNQAHVKKYKKLLIEKEWTKHKTETEMNLLKKKISKVDLTDLEIPDKSVTSPELTVKRENTTLPKIKCGKLKKVKFKPKSGK